MSINGQESGGGEEGLHWSDVYLIKKGERRFSPEKEAATFIPCSEPLCRWLVLGEWSRSAGARIIARARGEARTMVGVQFFFIFRIVVGVFVIVTSKNCIWVILNGGGPEFDVFLNVCCIYILISIVYIIIILISYVYSTVVCGHIVSGVGLTEWSSCRSVLVIIFSDHRYGLPWWSDVALRVGHQSCWLLMFLRLRELGQ